MPSLLPLFLLQVVASVEEKEEKHTTKFACRVACLGFSEETHFACGGRKRRGERRRRGGGERGE